MIPLDVRASIRAQLHDRAREQRVVALRPGERPFVVEGRGFSRAALSPVGRYLLASDDADYVHGTSIFVDGGMTLYPGFAAGG